MANSYLDELNPPQKQAVTFGNGPLLILAGAGSGKTRALTFRAAYLIKEKGVDPTHLLLVTFTNKAAAEMKQRLKKLVGSQLPYCGTFHSFCLKLLRIEGDKINLNQDFVIYDEDDSLEVIKKAVKNLNLDIKPYKPQSFKAAISGAKNELISSLEYASFSRGRFQEMTAAIFREYDRLLALYGALDFDDLLLNAVKLLRTDKATLNKYRLQFEHILVDEYQDTNKAQYELTKLLSSRWHNLTAVGDFSQCLPSDTVIKTPNGAQKIKNIRVGEKVISACGHSHTNQFLVKKIYKRQYRGNLIEIATKNGKKIRLTPNHILFARLASTPNAYHIYLMYRQDKGYRIGIAKGERLSETTQKRILGIATRGNQEAADKMWIVKTCDSRGEANFWESYLAFAYGVPTTVFDTCGRSMLLEQKQIDQLFKSIDTKSRVVKLMNDFELDPRFPHYRPRGTSGRKTPDRQIVHLKFFNDPRISLRSPWCAHRICLNTNDKKLEKTVKDFGFYTRPGRKNTWRTELLRLNYEDAETTAEKLSRVAGKLDVSYEAFLVAEAKKFYFQPASHLQPFMKVCMYENGKIIEEEITQVKKVNYHGYVYDIDIDHVHNYLANDIVVHNSIYSWRGADYRNLLRLKENFTDLTIINLEQNYRSTQNILTAANQVIIKNTLHPVLNLWTPRPRGAKLAIYEARDEKDEADYLVKLIKAENNFNRFAVLYRTNAQSRSIEEAFIQHGIPYILVGGTRFYGRKEIKDCLAYLRFLVNPKDTVSYERLEKLGRGQLDRFIGWQEENRSKLNQLTTTQVLDKTLKITDYLSRFDPKDETDLMRLENVKELKTVARELPKLSEFLENVALVEQSDIPRQQQKDNAVTLMTLHASKGLEFDTVFLIGMEEGLFPHSRSLLSRDELEEERRLCYVGITRAKNKVYFSYTRRRLYFGQYSSNAVSRFLADIDSNLLELINAYSRS